MEFGEGFQFSESWKGLYKRMAVIYAGCYAVALFIMLHYVQLYNGEGGTFAYAFFFCIPHALRHPLELGLVLANPGRLWRTFLFLTLVFASILVVFMFDAINRRHEDETTAKGSAKLLNSAKDYKKLADKYQLPQKDSAYDPNIILSKNIKYGLKEKKNTNVLIIGSAGSGKSFGIIKPNLMQLNSSYVITDPSGEIFQSLGHMLLENGYNVKIFSVTNMSASNSYNPFDYCYDEEGAVDETRVSTMITLFLQNAGEMASAKQKSGDDFWDKAARALLNACAMYLLEFRPKEEQNMYQILRLVQMGKVDESKSSAETKLDKRFNDARKQDPEAHCLSSYDTFKLAPAKTANSILISAGVDLNMFNQDKVRNLTTTDYYAVSRSAETGQIRKYARDEDGSPIRTEENINLKTIGDEKTALFIMTPQADTTYNFLVTMLYSQLLEVLYGRGEKLVPKKWGVRGKGGQPILAMIDTKEEADELVSLYKGAAVVKKKDQNNKYAWYIFNHNAPLDKCLKGMGDTGFLKKVYSEETGKTYLAEFDGCTVYHNKGNGLPVHVQLLLDEFANIGEIPRFPNMLATSRKYEISIMIVLQSLAQLKSRYKDDYSSIISNCICKVFLGTQDPETCEWLSKMMGERTIRLMGQSMSSSGGNMSINIDARPLAKPDEVARLDEKKCYVLVGSEQPAVDWKFMSTDHVRWEETGDMNDEYVMMPENFCICSEKKPSANSNTNAFAAALDEAVDNKLENQKTAAKGTEVRSKREAAAAAGNKPDDKTGPMEYPEYDAEREAGNRGFGKGYRKGYKSYLPRTKQKPE